MHIYIYLETLPAKVFAGGISLLQLRRRMVETPETFKTAGI